MFGYWYNSSIRRYIVLMGALFNHIAVKRYDNNDEIFHQKVPITYGSKERFVQRLNNITNPMNENNTYAEIETILPRMNLTVVDMMYNPLFKTNITNREIRSVFGETPRTTSQFNPVPWKMIFELGIYTRHEDDMFQIVEQILPYFQPNFPCKITELHDNEIKVDRDVQITIQSLAIDEEYDGDKTSRRRIEWSIIFEVDAWFYPPLKDVNNEIKTVYVDFFANTHRLAPEGNFEGVDAGPCPDSFVERDKWNGKVQMGYSDNEPIPTGLHPQGPRGVLSGCDGDN